MKKIISLILAVIMIFAVTSVGVFAADETQKPVKITFIYDDADISGTAGMEKTKVIYVDYEEDYNSQIPNGVYYTTEDGERYKYFTGTWETTTPGYNTKLYEKGHFPKFAANDGITEITFKANMEVEKVTVENVLGGAAEEVLGESTMAFFNYIIEQIKVWFGKLMLYIRNFM